MNIKSFIIMTAAGILLAACQSNTYRIKGTVEGADNIDTLYLTTDFQTGNPNATLLVKGGKFELEGEADSTYFCLIYSKDQTMSVPLFIEPGTIKVKLAGASDSRVGGTAINDEWQRMNDSIMLVGKEINSIAEKIYANENATEEEQQKTIEQIDRLNQRFGEIVQRFTERNIKNELGYFLLTSYPEDIIPNKERMRLIKMMPEKMRQRSVIQQMVQLIDNATKTEEGAMMEDFMMPSIEGAPMSIMSEVKKNRLTVIDFWASWCAPCREETPFMVGLYNRYKDKGLGIIGISLDEDADAWKQATDQMGIVWPQMSDLKGWESQAAQMFNITAIPHTIVVDQNGKILRRGLRRIPLEEFITEQLK